MSKGLVKLGIDNFDYNWGGNPVRNVGIFVTRTANGLGYKTNNGFKIVPYNYGTLKFKD